MKIRTSLPVNISEKYSKLFINKEGYTLKKLTIKKLKNVFVSNNGTVIRNFFLQRKSAENLVGFYDQTFYYSHWRKAIEQYFVCKHGKSLKSIRLDDEKFYFTIHTPWFGYFTWFTTYLPRLLSVKEKFPNAVLIVPEEWKNNSYVQDTLAMIDQLEMKLIPEDHHVFIKNYILAEVRPWTSIFYPEQLFQVRNLCFNHLDKMQLNIKTHQRIFVSRRKANRRNITNELEVTSFLKKHDFVIICFEDYTIYEQIHLVKNAKILISLHGAGLTNALFMDEGSILLELTPKVDKPSQFRFPFWRIASHLKLKYWVQFCETVDNGEIDFYSRNVEIDLIEFENNLKAMLAEH